MGTEPEKGGHSSSLPNNDTNVNTIENILDRGSVDHGRECRAWFNSLKPDDKACATASANARFIRMFLNLSKRMDSRTVNGNAGNCSTPSNGSSSSCSSSKPANHPRSDAAHASLPLSVSRRNLTKMYDTRNIAIQSPVCPGKGKSEKKSHRTGGGEQGIKLSLVAEDSSCTTSKSDTITSQSEGPKRIQGTKQSHGDADSSNNLKGLLLLQETGTKLNIQVGEHGDVLSTRSSQETLSSACNDAKIIGKRNRVMEMKQEAVSKREDASSDMSSKSKKDNVDSCYQGKAFTIVNKVKSTSGGTLLQSKARLAALSTPYGQNGIEVILMDPLWFDGAKHEKSLFSVAEDILQVKSKNGGFLSTVPKCEGSQKTDPILPSWLLPCSEAFWRIDSAENSKSRKAEATTSVLLSEEVNIPFHFLLLASIELSIWASYCSSKGKSGFFLATDEMKGLPAVLGRAKKFLQHGLTIGHTKSRQLMKPVTQLNSESLYVSEYDSLDKLILLPISWVVQHGRDAEQCGGNNVGYAGVAHPVWKCVEKVEQLITDIVWSRHDAVSKSSDSLSNSERAAGSHNGNTGNGSKKKKKNKSKKKKKRSESSLNDGSNTSTITNNTKFRAETRNDSSNEIKNNQMRSVSSARSVVSNDCCTNKSVSSTRSSGSSSASSSLSSSQVSSALMIGRKSNVSQKQVKHESILVTTSAGNSTVIVNSSKNQVSVDQPRNSHPTSNDGDGEWDVVQNNKGSNKYGNNKQKGHQPCDNSVDTYRSGNSRNSNGKNHRKVNNKRHLKAKKVVAEIIYNSVISRVEDEVAKRSKAAGMIQSGIHGRNKQQQLNTIIKNTAVDTHSYSGTLNGAVGSNTTTTTAPESTVASSSVVATAHQPLSANEPPKECMVPVTNCVGGSTTSSVASSLDNHNANGGNSRDVMNVGYHLLNVCNRLSCDMATFMGRRSMALAARRRERGCLLQALQSTAGKIWTGMPCHVEMYGSCATQLDLPSSDLDLVICGLPIKKNTQNTAPSRVYQLAEELERQPWAVHVKPIATASVPVVKLLADPSRISGNHRHSAYFNQDLHPAHPGVISGSTGIHHTRSQPPTQLTSHHPPYMANPWRGADAMNGLLQVDITFEGPEHGGVGSTEFAARMVQDAMNESRLPRPEATPTVQVVMVLKELLAQRRLNEPFSGGLSSYGLILMVFAIIRENRALRTQYKAQAEMAAAAQEEPSYRQRNCYPFEQQPNEVSPTILPKTSSWASIAKNSQVVSLPSGTSISRSNSAPISNSHLDQQRSGAVITSNCIKYTRSVSSGTSLPQDTKKSSNSDGVYTYESNDILEVLCSGEPTAGKLLMHFLLFYGHIFDATASAIEVRSPHSPVIPRQVGPVFDPNTGMLTADQLVVYDPLEGAEKNNVARSCFAWSSIRWVFAQSYTTLTNTLDRRGSRGEDISDDKNPLLELLMSY